MATAQVKRPLLSSDRSCGWRAAPAALWTTLRAQLAPQQVVIEFPIDELAKRADALNALRSGYVPVVPQTDQELAEWAELMNAEPGFGQWSVNRIRRELLTNLVPGAALTIWHEGRVISCACAIDMSTTRRRVAMGMYLYVLPKYRGRTEVAYATTYGMLYQCVSNGYDQVLATTDPQRLSALALYLSNGCVPVRRTLRSWIEWRRIMKRLRPTLEKMQRRKSRNAAFAAPKSER